MATGLYLFRSFVCLGIFIVAIISIMDYATWSRSNVRQNQCKNNAEAVIFGNAFSYENTNPMYQSTSQKSSGKTDQGYVGASLQLSLWNLMAVSNNKYGTRPSKNKPSSCIARVSPRGEPAAADSSLYGKRDRLMNTAELFSESSPDARTHFADLAHEDGNIDAERLVAVLDNPLMYFTDGKTNKEVERLASFIGGPDPEEFIFDSVKTTKNHNARGQQDAVLEWANLATCKKLEGKRVSTDASVFSSIISRQYDFARGATIYEWLCRSVQDRFKTTPLDFVDQCEGIFRNPARLNECMEKQPPTGRLMSVGTLQDVFDLIKANPPNLIDTKNEKATVSLLADAALAISQCILLDPGLPASLPALVKAAATGQTDSKNGEINTISSIPPKVWERVFASFFRKQGIMSSLNAPPKRIEDIMNAKGTPRETVSIEDHLSKALSRLNLPASMLQSPYIDRTKGDVIDQIIALAKESSSSQDFFYDNRVVAFNKKQSYLYVRVGNKEESVPNCGDSPLHHPAYVFLLELAGQPTECMLPITQNPPDSVHYAEHINASETAGPLRVRILYENLPDSDDAFYDYTADQVSNVSHLLAKDCSSQVTEGSGVCGGPAQSHPGFRCGGVTEAYPWAQPFLDSQLEARSQMCVHWFTDKSVSLPLEQPEKTVYGGMRCDDTNDFKTQFAGSISAFDEGFECRSGTEAFPVSYCGYKNPKLSYLVAYQTPSTLYNSTRTPIVALNEPERGRAPLLLGRPTDLVLYNLPLKGNHYDPETLKQFHSETVTYRKRLLDFQLNETHAAAEELRTIKMGFRPDSRADMVWKFTSDVYHIPEPYRSVKRGTALDVLNFFQDERKYLNLSGTENTGVTLFVPRDVPESSKNIVSETLDHMFYPSFDFISILNKYKDADTSDIDSQTAFNRIPDIDKPYANTNAAKNEIVITLKSVVTDDDVEFKIDMSERPVCLYLYSTSGLMSKISTGSGLILKDSDQNRTEGDHAVLTVSEPFITDTTVVVPSTGRTRRAFHAGLLFEITAFNSSQIIVCCTDTYFVNVSQELTLRGLSVYGTTSTLTIREYPGENMCAVVSLDPGLTLNDPEQLMLIGSMGMPINTTSNEPCKTSDSVQYWCGSSNSQLYEEFNYHKNAGVQCQAVAPAKTLGTIDLCRCDDSGTAHLDYLFDCTGGNNVFSTIYYMDQWEVVYFGHDGVLFDFIDSGYYNHKHDWNGDITPADPIVSKDARESIKLNTAVRTDAAVSRCVPYIPGIKPPVSITRVDDSKLLYDSGATNIKHAGAVASLYSGRTRTYYDVIVPFVAKAMRIGITSSLERDMDLYTGNVNASCEDSINNNTYVFNYDVDYSLNASCNEKYTLDYAGVPVGDIDEYPYLNRESLFSRREDHAPNETSSWFEITTDLTRVSPWRFINDIAIAFIDIGLQNVPVNFTSITDTFALDPLSDQKVLFDTPRPPPTEHLDHIDHVISSFVQFADVSTLNILTKASEMTYAVHQAFLGAMLFEANKILDRSISDGMVCTEHHNMRAIVVTIQVASILFVAILFRFALLHVCPAYKKDVAVLGGGKSEGFVEGLSILFILAIVLGSVPILLWFSMVHPGFEESIRVQEDAGQNEFDDVQLGFGAIMYITAYGVFVLLGLTMSFSGGRQSKSTISVASGIDNRIIRGSIYSKKNKH